MKTFCSKRGNGPIPSRQGSTQQPGRGIGANNRAETNNSAPQQNKGKAPMTSGQGQRLYEMRKADEPNAPVAQGTLSLHSVSALLLFDSGATHSFISSSCVKELGFRCNALCEPFVVGLPNGDKITGTEMITEFPIKIQGKQFQAGLICIPITPYDIILGMDWMNRHGAIIEFASRTVTVVSGGKYVCKFQGFRDIDGGKMISAIQANRLLHQGCTRFLCYLETKEKEEMRIENIRIDREYVDVFSEEIPGLSPRRSVEFSI